VTTAAFVSPLGFTYTPPAGFEALPDLPAGRTAAVAPAPAGAAVQLAVAYAEAGSDPAAIAIAVVDAPLELDRNSPERIAALAIDYLHDVLDADLHIEWIERLPAAGTEGLELAGRIMLDDVDGKGERVAQFAFLPFGARQLVVTASLPAARFPVLGPAIERSVAALSFTAVPPAPASHRAEVGAAVGGVLGLVVAMTRLLWRRKRDFLTPPNPSD